VKTPVCDLLGIDLPIFAFSHCRDVVIEVSKAGGFGVLGATAYTPDSSTRSSRSSKMRSPGGRTASTCCSPWFSWVATKVA
jgi:hypothetical protein